ncbi:carboxylesterase family domain-containing protein [Phthorimaea operculella]|nr:carboxylesterase family domain-containing protein [Phthorimaea operculella]
MVQVKVSEGVLEGVEIDNDYGGKIFSFKGIPFAQPPVGNLRFKAPQPVQPWDGVRSAKEHGSMCYQKDIQYMKSTEPSGSEDCLYLNVYSPNLKPDKPVPVMFFIHGGAFKYGNGHSDIYGPEYLLKHDVILVTCNYRTEVLGFLCLDTEEVPGNAGMKDQVAALRWTKNNIHNFGGDPENITIFGESAGGACVSFHLVSPMSRGLFKRAIVQSGAATNHWTIAQEPRERAKALARSLGLDSDNDKELYEFFNSLPVDKLINITVPITLEEEANVNFRVDFAPVNERKFVSNEVFFSGDIYNVLRNGIHEGVEVMAGYCKDESYFILGIGVEKEKIIDQYNSYPELFAPREIAWNSSLKTTFEVGRKMREFYFKDAKLSTENLDTLIKFVSTNMFNYGIVQWQKISSAKNKTYLYKFSCYSERNVFAGMLGLTDIIGTGKVLHADDVFHIFHVGSLPKVEKDSETYKLMNNVTTLWTNFAKFGNPTPDSSLGVKWEPFTAEEKNYLDVGNQLRASQNPDEEEIKFWETIFKQYYPNCVA